MSIDVTSHARALSERGYTIIPGQVSDSRTRALNLAADEALDAVSKAILRGVKPQHTLYNDYVRAARCFYAWDHSCRDLLEHPTIHSLGKAVLGKMRLYDMAVLEALPKPPAVELEDFDWHRDFVPSLKDPRAEYLWIFTCLTDVTQHNGATWVLPGSQHEPSREASASITKEKPSDAVQLTANKGDMIAINPAMLHSVGENQTQSGRRLALVGLCRGDRPPLLNHWAMASPQWRSNMAAGARSLIRTSDLSVGEIWEVLPGDWQVSPSGSVRRVRRILKETYQATRSAARRVAKRAIRAEA